MHKIIIRMPNWLGDAIMATAILQDIKNKFSNSEITLMCLEEHVTLFENIPFINDLLSFKKFNFFKIKDRRNLIKKIKNNNYDIGILLTNSFSSAWFFFFGKVKKRLGYKYHFRSLLLNIKSKPQVKKLHLVSRYKTLLTKIQIPISFSAPTIYLNKKTLLNVKSLLNKKKKQIIIGINPLAEYGPAKCWPKEKFIEICQKLLQDANIFLIFFSNKTQKNNIFAITKHLEKDNILDLSGKTSIMELCCYISLCNCFISNDSGPMHIAAALKTPLIAIFGSTCPISTGPYNHGVIIKKDIRCSPCFKRHCPKEFTCMNKITTEEVLKKTHEIIYI